MNNDLFRNKYRIPSARAYWHDYNMGYYFITICTDKREHYFGEIIDNKMMLSQLGNYAESYIEKMKTMYDDTKILSSIIMPNHVHIILAIDKHEKINNSNNDNNNDSNEHMSAIAKKCGRLSNIILKYKANITRFAYKNDIPFKWQTRFHDRIIRNNNDLINTDIYIKNNVINWKDDEYYPYIPL